MYVCTGIDVSEDEEKCVKLECSEKCGMRVFCPASTSVGCHIYGGRFPPSGKLTQIQFILRSKLNKTAGGRSRQDDDGKHGVVH